MILIISEPDDATTDSVINWLKYYNVEYLRINNTNVFDFFKLTINADGNIDFVCQHDDTVIQLSKITGYWYRRGKLSLNVNAVGKQKYLNLSEVTNRFLLNEFDAITEFIYNELHNIKKSVGNIYENNTNKLINLKIANKCGMNIPRTWILTNKQEVQDIIKEYKILLTKPITQSGLYYENDEICFSGQSYLFTEEIINNFPDTFAPTLFQEYIDKAYELRVFYFKEEIYISAIFSQLDEMTKIDFRNYNFQKPNRTPPYKAPDSLKLAIIKFMDKTNMKSGSIDILVGKDKRYYFLEVNPIEQFYQVSYPCNFYLEKRIAKYFKNGK